MNRNDEMNNLQRKLVSVVDTLLPDVVDFTMRLVSKNSTLGSESGVLLEMEDELQRLGYTPVQIPIDKDKLASYPEFAPVPWSYDGRYNVAATRPADGVDGKSVLFNGHLDVVSPEPIERWNTDPFTPIEKDGWLYGRGAGDMKAGVAAMTYAVRAFDLAGIGLNAPVTIEGVIEEECSGNGALACRLAGLNADAILIPEPFGPTILTSQIGVAWFKVTLRGVPKHALDTQGGINAIEKCYPLFKALRNLEKDLNRTPSAGFENIDHPANLNIGIIKGGDWPSTVPALAEFHCRIGFLPGTTYQQIQSMVIQTIAAAAAEDEWLSGNLPQVDFYGFRSEGHKLELDQPAFQTLSHCHESLSGQPSKPFVSTCTTDLRAFVSMGHSQATCFGPIAENIHAENERVQIDSILHTTKVYTLFLARWCGVSE